MTRRERLVGVAVIGVLALVSAAPVLPLRSGRALVLLLGLMVIRAVTWSDGWRGAVVLVAVGLLLLHGELRGAPVLVALFLAGEGIEQVGAHPELRSWLLAALAGLGILAAAQGLAQAFNLDPLTCVLKLPERMACATPRLNAVVGFAGDANTYASILALTLPALLLVAPSWRWRVLGGAVMLAALVAARSTGPVLALAVAATWWAWRRGPRVRWLVAGSAAAALAGYVTVVDAPGSERLAIWTHTALLLPAHPWTGAGLDSFAAARFADLRHGGTVWAEAHNEWLQWAYETGAVGVLALSAYLGRLGWRLAHAPASSAVRAVQAMLLIAAIVAGVHFAAHVAMTAIVLILALGLAEGLVRQRPVTPVTP